MALICAILRYVYFIFITGHKNHVWFADMAIVIVDSRKLDNHAALGILNGFLTKSTTIIVKNDFIFDKYAILHTLGHVLGIGHERGDTKYPHTIHTYPYPYHYIILYAHGYVMSNGYCDIMADPIQKNCTSGLFFSNKNLQYHSTYPSGDAFANAAQWIRNIKFILEEIGHEISQCPTSMYDPHVLQCLILPISHFADCSNLIKQN